LCWLPSSLRWLRYDAWQQYSHDQRGRSIRARQILFRGVFRSVHKPLADSLPFSSSPGSLPNSPRNHHTRRTSALPSLTPSASYLPRHPSRKRQRLGLRWMYSRACSQLLLGRGDWTLNRSMDNITEAGSILSHDASSCRFSQRRAFRKARALLLGRSIRIGDERDQRHESLMISINDPGLTRCRSSRLR